MVPLGTVEKVARIVNYDRFYIPRIEEFKVGFNYEYVQFAFSKVLTNLPDLDETGKKPTCIYSEHWAKGIWGSPFGIGRIEYIIDEMRNNRIRARKKLTTLYLRTLLKKNPLRFNWKNLDIVVFPKKVIDHDGVEILDEHVVYVNGVLQKLIRTKPESKLHKKWFSKDKTGTPEELDWRYLLGLDFPELPAYNLLYLHFEGVFAGDESLFKNICDNYTDGKLAHAEYGLPYSSKLSKKQIRVQQDLLTAEEHSKKKSEQGVKPIRVTTDQKLLDELSIAVKAARTIATAKKKRTAEDEARALMAKQKVIDRNYQSQQANHKKMHNNHVMVCVRHTESKKVSKVPRSEARKMVKDGYEYAPKTAWKEQIRHERELQKAETEEKYEWIEAKDNKPPLLYYGWVPDPNDPEKGSYQEIEAQLADPKIHIRIIPGFNGTNRKQSRYEPKKKKVFNSLCETVAVIDSKNNPVKEKAAITVPDPQFEHVQVFKKFYKYEMNKFTGRAIKVLDHQEPWLIPGYNDEFKRVLKKDKKEEVHTRVIEFTKSKMQTLRKVVKLKTALRR